MIRPASFLDIPLIINLGNRYVEEEVKAIGHHSAVWDADVSAQNLCQSMHLPDGFLWVAVVDGEVVGFLWAACHPLAPWDLTKVASDFLFYIVPEHRGSMLGWRLLRQYKVWAKERGCSEARLSLASGINEERMGRLYDKLGFASFGTVFRLQL